jgi:hypothetical protein
MKHKKLTLSRFEFDTIILVYIIESCACAEYCDVAIEGTFDI